MFIEMKVTGLTIDPVTNSPIVVLKDLDGNNALPIWIGILEANSIAMQLEKIEFPRPMTHDLMKELIDCTKAEVKRVEVVDLKDNVYYATIHLGLNETVFKLDARPSDAIAMALRMSTPIFVDSEVLSKSKSLEVTFNAKSKNDESKSITKMLDDLSADAFGKYKM